jgi:hypothetical protein
VTAAPLCDCPSAPVPHRHPTPEMLAPASSRPKADAPALTEDELDTVLDEGAVALLKHIVETTPSLPPRPPAAIPHSDKRPLNLIQVTRRDSVRFALQYWTDVADAEKDVDDIGVLETAERIAEFIRNGTVPGREKEA